MYAVLEYDPKAATGLLLRSGRKLSQATVAALHYRIDLADNDAVSSSPMKSLDMSDYCNLAASNR